MLGGDENVVTVLLAVFSIGIGLGALACERLSGRKVEIGLVPFGSIGMTVFAVDLWLASRGLAPVRREGRRGVPARGLVASRDGRPLPAGALRRLLLGAPVRAHPEPRAKPTHRARIIAANNILNALFMIVAALMATALLSAGLTLPQLFLVVGLMNAAVAAYIYLLVPEFLMRFLCWLLVHSVYRLRKAGIENIPEEGPAVIVCNHVSFVDALVILAASPRPIRFVMDHRIFRIPVLSFVFRTGKAIPDRAGQGGRGAHERAPTTRSPRRWRRASWWAIFPEGRITETGEIYPFRTGITRIVERTPVPVVPMALKGLWGSFFSRHGGAAMTKPFRRGVFSRIGAGGGARGGAGGRDARGAAGARAGPARRLALGEGGTPRVLHSAERIFPPASCPETLSARSSPSPRSANPTARPSAASSTGARRAWRSPRATSSPTSTGASPGPRGT